MVHDSPYPGFHMIQWGEVGAMELRCVSWLWALVQIVGTVFMCMIGVFLLMFYTSTHDTFHESVSRFARHLLHI